MRRSAALSVIALLAGLVWVPPADAHTVTGVSPTNYRSRITGVVPPLPGVSVRLLDLGRRFELTNRGTTDVIVLGYQGEPYLRVGPQGVFENQRSPTVDANKVGAGPTTTATPTTPLATVNPGATPVPPAADPATGSTVTMPPGSLRPGTEAGVDQPPEWRRISSGHTARWRDHRTRWEGADPDAVQANPGRAHAVAQWDVPLQQGGTNAAVRGVITWVPPPNPLPWVLLALGLLAATVAGAFSRNWGWWLSGAVALLVAADMVTSVSAAMASESGAGGVTLKVVLGGFMTTVAWVVGALAIGALQRQHSAGLLAAGLTALVLTLYTLPDALGLIRSQVATAAPPVAARAATAAVLGLGLGLLASVVVVFKRNPGLLPSNRPESAPAQQEPFRPELN